MKEFIVIRGCSEEALAQIYELMRIGGFVENDAEAKYYGLSTLFEDITQVTYFHREEVEEDGF